MQTTMELELGVDDDHYLVLCLGGMEKLVSRLILEQVSPKYAIRISICTPSYWMNSQGQELVPGVENDFGCPVHAGQAGCGKLSIITNAPIEIIRALPYCQAILAMIDVPVPTYSSSSSVSVAETTSMISSSATTTLTSDTKLTSDNGVTTDNGVTAATSVDPLATPAPADGDTTKTHGGGDGGGKRIKLMAAHTCSYKSVKEQRTELTLATLQTTLNSISIESWNRALMLWKKWTAKWGPPRVQALAQSSSTNVLSSPLTYRASCVRDGAHAFNSMDVLPMLGDAVGVCYPSYNVDLIHSDLEFVTFIVRDHVCIGLSLLPHRTFRQGKLSAEPTPFSPEITPPTSTSTSTSTSASTTPTSTSTSTASTSTTSKSTTNTSTSSTSTPSTPTTTPSAEPKTTLPPKSTAKTTPIVTSTISTLATTHTTTPQLATVTRITSTPSLPITTSTTATATPSLSPPLVPTLPLPPPHITSSPSTCIPPTLHHENVGGDNDVDGIVDVDGGVGVDGVDVVVGVDGIDEIDAASELKVSLRRSTALLMLMITSKMHRRQSNTKQRLIVVDPCGGFGTIPRVAAELPQMYDYALGGDVDEEAVVIAKQQVKHSVVAGARHHTEMMGWDATMLPLRDGCVDACVTDLPFGLRCLNSREIARLYPRIVREAARVLTDGGIFMAITCLNGPQLVKQALHAGPWELPCGYTTALPVNIGGIKAELIIARRIGELCKYPHPPLTKKQRKALKKKSKSEN